MNVPLEIQEHVIASGPQDNSARVQFLCQCALVCKDWLPKSRSLLELYIVLGSLGRAPRSDTLQVLGNPSTTLTYSIHRMDFDRRTSHLIPLINHLPSVSHISFIEIPFTGADKFPKTNDLRFPNVRTLELWDNSFETVEHLESLLKSFPGLNRLKSVGLHAHWPGVLPLNTSYMPPLPLIEIKIVIPEGRKDIDILDPLIMASHSLKRITFLQVAPGEIPNIGELCHWISTSSALQNHTAKIQVGIKISSSPRLGADFLTLMGHIHFLHICFPTREDVEITVPEWVQQASHLHSITLSYADDPVQDLDTDWTILADSLASRTTLTSVRFIKCQAVVGGMACHYGMHAIVERLRIIARPNVSLWIEMGFSRDSLTRVLP